MISDPLPTGRFEIRRGVFQRFHQGRHLPHILKESIKNGIVMFRTETERLLLRELFPDDLDSLFELLSDPEAMKFYPRPYTKKETEDWIARSRKSYKDNGFGLWAVVLKSEERFIGQGGISLQPIDNQTVPEIGYHIQKNYWNRGLASELAQQCLNVGFWEFDLKEIFIHTYVENIPSRRVAEKVGMIKRKEYPKVMKQNGTIMQHVVYSLKVSQYRSI